MPNIWKTQDVVLSIGNTQITGKDCMCQRMDIKLNDNFATPVMDGMTPQSMGDSIVEITLTLLCKASNFIQEVWEEDYKPKIRNKKVDDCSIQELLFAVREKAKLK